MDTVSGKMDCGSITLWDIKTGEELKSFTGHTGPVRFLTTTADGKHIISNSIDSTTRLWNIETGKEIAMLAGFKDGEWITITPEGYYDCSENGDKHINVRIGNNVYGIDNYRETFYRPELVKLALSGGKIEGMVTLEDVKSAPDVSIVNTPNNPDTDEVTVTLKITDVGGGIGDIKLFLNGTAIVLDSRGIAIISKDDKSIIKSYKIKIINGTNIIKAIVFNKDNTMQSNEVVYEITAAVKTLIRPSLYGIVIGIKDFKNPKLELKYTVADAELFAESMTACGSGLFEKVIINKLTTSEETTKENIIK
ncbi:hypothetical protein ES705_30459 [subsurface metagenome]